MQNTKSVDVTLTFWGENLVPDVLTSFLGQIPTHVRAKGQRPAGSLPLRPSLEKVSMWSFCTAKLCAGQSLSQHVSFITQNFGPKINAARNNGWIDQGRLFATIMLPDRSVEPWSWEGEIEIDVLQEIAAMKIPLSISVLYPGLADKEA